MLIHNFTFSDINSRDYGLFIRTKQSYDKPQRDMSIISVPGRDGDLAIDNGSFKNIDIKLGLRLFVPPISNNKVDNFNFAYSNAVKWLKQTAEYCVYSDSYDPDYYRLACIKSALTVTQKRYDIADFDVTFSCKPYKYRWDGDTVATLDSGSVSSITIYNPEDYDSLPLIKVYTAATYDPSTTRTHSFSLNGVTYSITQINGNCTIDSEMMNVYHGSINKNKNYQQTAFPKLIPGTNTLSLIGGGNVTKIEVTPRWRTI